MEKTFQSCVNGSCKNNVSIKFKDFHIIPFECKNIELQKLFSYFLYTAPNIESSFSKAIPQELHPNIFNIMIKDRHFEYYDFCSPNAVIEKKLQNACLAGELFCLKCKRFVCKMKQSEKGKRETELECFLRHIRNAIAHGRVYFFNVKSRYHIVFEDENTSKKISARIVCIKADLEHWKRVLSDSRNYK